MAIARAVCTCSTCGRKFEKTATKQNRRDADSWEAWASDHYDECPACYGKRMREAEAAKPVTAEIKLDLWERKIMCIIHGNTRPLAEKLKSMGYRWDENPAAGLIGFFSGHHKKCLCWLKYGEPEQIQAISDELKEIGVDTAIAFTDLDLMVFRERVQQHRQREADKQAQIDQLAKPVKPDCYPAGKWNGRFYGSPKYGYAVYIDGQKTPVTASQMQEIEKYIEARDAYRAEVERINTTRASMTQNAPAKTP